MVLLFLFLTHQTRMSMILYQNKLSLQICHGTQCGKLQNLKLEGNAAIKIASTGLVGKSWMIHFGFRVFDVNWLVGTLRKGIQS